MVNGATWHNVEKLKIFSQIYSSLLLVLGIKTIVLLTISSSIKFVRGM
jgi:hypothetical protein